jgi:glucose-6-phosphate isomerase
MIMIMVTTPLDYKQISSQNAAEIQTATILQNKNFIDVVFDEAHFEHLYNELNPLIGKYKTIVLVGIGGSSLGAKMLTRALFNNTYPQVFFLDNTSPYLIQNTLDAIDLESTLFLIQSKSGTTPEVISIFLKIEELLIESALSPQEHCLFVTEPTQNFLHTKSIEQGYPLVKMPVGLGGRFSVLSASGLVLATLLGIDTKSILLGAQDFFTSQIKPDTNYDAVTLAQTIKQNSVGRNILTLFNYSDRLKEFGSWATQLIAESVGKEGKGFTPLNATGVTDQHSLLQLFRDGPDDKIYVMLKLLDHEVSINMPNDLSAEFSYLSGKSFQEIFDAEYQGTVTSLKRVGRPVIEIVLPRLDAYYLGQLIALFELTTALLGFEMGINAYDQPGVEESKRITREILSQN